MVKVPAPVLDYLPPVLLKQISLPTLQKISPNLEIKKRALLLFDREPETRWISSLCDKNRVSLDIGANVGAFSCLLLRHSKVVHAFEANPGVFQTLKSNLGARAILENIALSDEPGNRQLRIPHDHPGLATLEPENDLGGEEIDLKLETIPVNAKKLDDFEIKNVGFIKIDVEGHEEAVLRGSVRTLNESRPSLYIELEERHKPLVVETVTDFMGELGYRGFFLTEKKFFGMEHFDKRRFQVASPPGQAPPDRIYIYNFIFLPKESLKRFARVLPLEFKRRP